MIYKQNLYYVDKWREIMNTVEPIKNLGVISEILSYFEGENKRDYMLMFLGFNTGLRISDLLKLKSYEVREKEFIYIREQKTKKERKIPILPHVKQEIERYLLEIQNQKYLFKGKYSDEHISRFRAYQILKFVQRKWSLQSLGTHTLRKTFGYHFYKSTKDIATLMVILNHDRESMTLKYIGMSQDRVNSAMRKWGGIKK
jgi:integrase